MRTLVFAVGLWLVASVCSAASPFDGKWLGDAGAEKITVTLATSAEGGKVTGSIVTEGGAAAGEQPIEWGFVKGDLVVFRVKRMFQTGMQPFIYIGKIDGEQIAFGRRPEDLSLGALREIAAKKVK